MAKFERQVSIDPDTGKTRVRLTVDGKPCRTRRLDSGRARSLIGFELMAKDLADASKWMAEVYSRLPPNEKSEDQENIETRYFQTDGEVDLLKPLFFAAIVNYAKCFVSTDGRGAKLEHRDHVGQVFADLHQKIMRYRHKLVAHAGDAFDDGEALVALSPIDSRYKVESNIWRLTLEDDRELDPSFGDLISHVRENVNRRITDLKQNLIDSEAKEIAFELRRE